MISAKCNKAGVMKINPSDEKNQAGKMCRLICGSRNCPLKAG